MILEENILRSFDVSIMIEDKKMKIQEEIQSFAVSVVAKLWIST